MGLVKETVEEATELILSKFSDDCFHYYWIVKLVIKLVVFLKKKNKKQNLNKLKGSFFPK